MKKLLGLATAVTAFACGETEPENQAPIAVGDIPPVTLTEEDVFTETVSEFFSDPDGDPLAFAARSSATNVVTPSMSNDTITVEAMAAGTATIAVTATDPGGLSASQTAEFTVERVNRAPVLNLPINDMTIAEDGEADFLLSYHFYDPDRDDLTYAANSSDADVVSVAIDTWSIVITAVAVGTAEIEATATDTGGLSASDTFTVTVVKDDGDKE
ncbi:MAG: Ig-like domain-containing protein [Gemmatimonadota bacterium]|nr:Ig-like domain-containing protein [Gemmatimonadota bacterium]